MARAWRQGTLALVLIGLLGALAAGVAGSSGTSSAVRAAGSADDRPNIVVVMTDDQNDYELAWMPRTRALLADRGMDLTDAISPHPLCCPARAELVTGQYAQNNGVRHNRGPYGGNAALDPVDTIGSWFSEAGYRTGFIGKYLNGYGAHQARPPGWDRWDPLVQGVYDYRNFTFLNDGHPESYRNDYVTQAIEERTNAAVRAFSAADEPFLLMSWHLAPHYRLDKRNHKALPAPAPQDRHRFTRSRPPSLDKPSYAEKDVSDQPRAFAHRRRPDDAQVRAEFRARLRSLQSVDRAVASLVRTLRSTGKLENTYLFFLSDNGYLLGEHRFIGKNVLAEEALQVPLLVAGPGIEPGSTSAAPASLVDLPATFADLAGLQPTRVLDGLSLVPVLRGEAASVRDTTLVQTGADQGDGWAQRGVRTARYLYATRSGDSDPVLYDRWLDPFETRNVAEDPRYAGVRESLESRRRQLLDCTGWTCNRSFGQPPDPAGQ
ncbi:sulfatase [Nocardioides houyundeii]|uniref:sulfatase family protein n=1 Tax=Nocardioides houyundeii TaxID=2045452 RepID=UPI000DF1A361|nr:sulfatase [Nocardioides houyundeii]